MYLTDVVGQSYDLYHDKRGVRPQLCVCRVCITRLWISSSPAPVECGDIRVHSRVIYSRANRSWDGVVCDLFGSTVNGHKCNLGVSICLLGPYSQAQVKYNTTSRPESVTNVMLSRKTTIFLLYLGTRGL